MKMNNLKKFFTFCGMVFFILIGTSCSFEGNKKSNNHLALLALDSGDSSSDSKDSCVQSKLENKKLIIGNCSSKTSIIGAEYKEAELVSLEFAEPSKITSVGVGAFSGNNLTSVVIPESITYIAEGAFRKNKISSVTIKLKKRLGPTMYYNTFTQNPLTKIVLSKDLFDYLSSGDGKKLRENFDETKNPVFCDHDGNKLKGTGTC